jgi:lipid-A-disaccharide synthase
MDCPAVLAYRVSWLTECIAHLVLPKASFRFAGLVNIIADKHVMTELLQRDFNIYNTAAEVLGYLRNTPARRKLLEAYADVRTQLGKPGATDRAAAAIANLLN